MFTDRYPVLASGYATKHDGKVWSSNVQERVAPVPASRSDNVLVRGAKVRRNMQRDCGTESKPRLSDGTLSVWTRRLGVP